MITILTFKILHITYINIINIKKATGADNIPAKVVRQCKVTVAQQLSSLINLFVNTGVFPDSLKVAQVTPIHKKNDPLNESNYRPVSVLLIFSKVYEKVIEIQLADYFDKIFNPFYVLLDVAMDVRPHGSDFWKTDVTPLIKTNM